MFPKAIKICFSCARSRLKNNKKKFSVRWRWLSGEIFMYIWFYTLPLPLPQQVKIRYMSEQKKILTWCNFFLHIPQPTTTRKFSFQFAGSSKMLSYSLFSKKKYLVAFSSHSTALKCESERKCCARASEHFFNKWKKISIKNNTISLESRLAARGCAFLLATSI